MAKGYDPDTWEGNRERNLTAHEADTDLGKIENKAAHKIITDDTKIKQDKSGFGFFGRDLVNTDIETSRGLVDMKLAFVDNEIGTMSDAYGQNPDPERAKLSDAFSVGRMKVRHLEGGLTEDKVNGVLERKALYNKAVVALENKEITHEQFLDVLGDTYAGEAGKDVVKYQEMIQNQKQSLPYEVAKSVEYNRIPGQGTRSGVNKPRELGWFESLKKTVRDVDTGGVLGGEYSVAAANANQFSLSKSLFLHQMEKEARELKDESLPGFDVELATKGLNEEQKKDVIEELEEFGEYAAQRVSAEYEQFNKETSVIEGAGLWENLYSGVGGGLLQLPMLLAGGLVAVPIRMGASAIPVVAPRLMSAMSQLAKYTSPMFKKSLALGAEGAANGVALSALVGEAQLASDRSMTKERYKEQLLFGAAFGAGMGALSPMVGKGFNAAMSWKRKRANDRTVLNEAIDNHEANSNAADNLSDSVTALEVPDETVADYVYTQRNGVTNEEVSTRVANDRVKAGILARDKTRDSGLEAFDVKPLSERLQDTKNTTEAFDVKQSEGLHKKSPESNVQKTLSEALSGTVKVKDEPKKVKADNNTIAVAANIKRVEIPRTEEGILARDIVIAKKELKEAEEALVVLGEKIPVEMTTVEKDLQGVTKGLTANEAEMAKIELEMEVMKKKLNIKRWVWDDEAVTMSQEELVNLPEEFKDVKTGYSEEVSTPLYVKQLGMMEEAVKQVKVVEAQAKAKVKNLYKEFEGETTVRDALTRLSKQDLTEEQRSVLKLLQTRDIDEKFTVKERYAKETDRIPRGAYTKDGVEVYKSTLSNRGFINTSLHEIIHAATKVKLKERDNTDLLNIAGELKKSPDKRLREVADSVDEMLTYAATSPNAGKLMKKVAVGDSDAHTEIMKVLEDIIAPSYEDKIKARLGKSLGEIHGEGTLTKRLKEQAKKQQVLTFQKADADGVALLQAKAEKVTSLYEIRIERPLENDIDKSIKTLAKQKDLSDTNVELLSYLLRRKKEIETGEYAVDMPMLAAKGKNLNTITDIDYEATGIDPVTKRFSVQGDTSLDKLKKIVNGLTENFSTDTSKLISMIDVIDNTFDVVPNEILINIGKKLWGIDKFSRVSIKNTMELPSGKLKLDELRKYIKHSDISGESYYINEDTFTRNSEQKDGFNIFDDFDEYGDLRKTDYRQQLSDELHDVEVDKLAVGTNVDKVYDVNADAKQSIHDAYKEVGMFKSELTELDRLYKEVELKADLEYVGTTANTPERVAVVTRWKRLLDDMAETRAEKSRFHNQYKDIVGRLAFKYIQKMHDIKPKDTFVRVGKNFDEVHKRTPKEVVEQAQFVRKDLDEGLEWLRNNGVKKIDEDSPKVLRDNIDEWNEEGKFSNFLTEKYKVVDAMRNKLKEVKAKEIEKALNASGFTKVPKRYSEHFLGKDNKYKLNKERKLAEIRVLKGKTKKDLSKSQLIELDDLIDTEIGAFTKYAENLKRIQGERKLVLGKGKINLQDNAYKAEINKVGEHVSNRKREDINNFVAGATSESEIAMNHTSILEEEVLAQASEKFFSKHGIVSTDRLSGAEFTGAEYRLKRERFNRKTALELNKVMKAVMKSSTEEERVYEMITGEIRKTLEKDSIFEPSDWKIDRDDVFDRLREDDAEVYAGTVVTEKELPNVEEFLQPINIVESTSLNLAKTAKQRESAIIDMHNYLAEMTGSIRSIKDFAKHKSMLDLFNELPKGIEKPFPDAIIKKEGLTIEQQRVKLIDKKKAKDFNDELAATKREELEVVNAKERDAKQSKHKKFRMLVEAKRGDYDDVDPVIMKELVEVMKKVDDSSVKELDALKSKLNKAKENLQNEKRLYKNSNPCE